MSARQKSSKFTCWLIWLVSFLVTGADGCSSGMLAREDIDHIALQSNQGFIACRDQDATVYSCYSLPEGCPISFSQYGSKYYLKLSDCNSAIPSGFIRCIGKTDRSCFVDFAIPDSCPPGQLLQPPNQRPFSSLSECRDFVGQVVCYQKVDDLYTCRNDTVGCNSDEIQTSNSMSREECFNYAPGFLARCMDDTGKVTCRSAARATFNFTSKTATTSSQLQVASPISSACLAGEKSYPSTFVYGLDRCRKQITFVFCYTYHENEALCTKDVACTGPWKTPIGTVPSSFPSCDGAIFQPSAYVKCGPYVCRPIEAGCAVHERPTRISSQDPTIRKFPTLESCMHYPLFPAKWLRCKSATSGWPYCYFQQCKDGDDIIKSNSAIPNQFTDALSCFYSRYWSQMCYNPMASPLNDYTCASDVDGCESGVPVKLYGGSADRQSVLDRCLDTNQRIWVRCALATRKGIVCRLSPSYATAETKNLVGCATGAGEAQLAPTTQHLTKPECLAYEAYILCYNFMSTTNPIKAASSFVTPLECRRDYLWCSGDLIRFPPSASITEVSPDKDTCLDYKFKSGFIRCERLAENGILNAGLVTCRPAELQTCSSGEIKVGDDKYPDVDSCLLHGAWCRCRNSYGAVLCNQYLSSDVADSCCGVASIQLPNYGTFYNTDKSCLAGTFT